MVNSPTSARREQSAFGLRHHELGNPCALDILGPQLDHVKKYATHVAGAAEAWESKWAQRVGMHWWVTGLDTQFRLMGSS
jgi:hypothetical protein